MSESVDLMVQASVQRLFPEKSWEEGLIALLLERAQRELIKYQVQARHFRKKYQRDFATFRQQIIASDPLEEMEQDYFDWELAETRCQEMKDEIAQLRASQINVT